MTRSFFTTRARSLHRFLPLSLCRHAHQPSLFSACSLHRCVNPHAFLPAVLIHLCRVSILGIPKARKLKTLTFPEGSRRIKRSRPTPRPRPRLARPRGRELRLARPLGCGLRLARPQGRGFCLARPRARGLRLVRRGPIPPPTTAGPSVWAWVKTPTPGKRLTRLDVTHGHDGPYLGIHIKNSVGRADAVLPNPRTDADRRVSSPQRPLGRSGTP